MGKVREPTYFTLFSRAPHYLAYKDCPNNSWLAGFCEFVLSFKVRKSCLFVSPLSLLTK